MADLADVEQALAVAIDAAVYPQGDTNPSAIGAPVRIGRGWPTGEALDADMIAGIVNISVWSPPMATRNVSRNQLEWIPQTPVLPTLTATVSGLAITFAGTGGLGQVVGVLVAYAQDQVAYAYRLVLNDTPATAATALAAVIPNSSASGAVLTIAGARVVSVSIVADSPAIKVLRQQQQAVRAIIWAPTPALRDSAASVVDAILAATYFLPMPDGSTAHLIYRGTSSNDITAKDDVWRRDLVYTVEYQTTLVQSQPVVLFPLIDITINSSSIVWAGPGFPTPQVLTDGATVEEFVFFDAADNLTGTEI